MNQKKIKTPFEVLDHPADIGIKVTGASLEELFTNAAIGTIFLIADIHEASHHSKEKIDIEADDLEELFTSWLDEILYLFDAKGLFVTNTEQIKINKSVPSQRMILNAVVNCQKFNKENHEIKSYLKAVTHHQLKINQLKDSNWEATVYFDV